METASAWATMGVPRLRTGSNPIDLLTFQVSASVWPYGSISVDLGLLALFLSMSVIEGWLALQFSPLVHSVQMCSAGRPVRWKFLGTDDRRLSIDVPWGPNWLLLK